MVPLPSLYAQSTLYTPNSMSTFDVSPEYTEKQSLIAVAYKLNSPRVLHLLVVINCHSVTCLNKANKTQAIIISPPFQFPIHTKPLILVWKPGSGLAFY